MSRSRSRSPSPRGMRDKATRRRSRSPRLRDDDRSQNYRERPRGRGGFKWKEKRRETDEDRDSSQKRLERGYRKRSSSPKRDNAGTSVEDKFGVADKFGVGDKFGAMKSGSDKRESKSKAPDKASTTQSAPLGEPMIIVHVNDRLGTKASIPCLASDPIRLFKAQVAARIGREPHEIMLKRQGERSFKDSLTLEDYGVSNGVQLDLEVDTGD